MAYQRKTKDRWDIMTNWGYGWECENSEYTREDARRSFREYRENLSGRAEVRLEKHLCNGSIMEGKSIWQRLSDRLIESI